MTFPPDKDRNHQKTQYNKDKNVWGLPALGGIWANAGRDLCKLVWNLKKYERSYCRGEDEQDLLCCRAENGGPGIGPRRLIFQSKCEVFRTILLFKIFRRYHCCRLVKGSHDYCESRAS